MSNSAKYILSLVVIFFMSYASYLFFESNRRVHRKSYCQSNLSELYKAIQLYSQDCGEFPSVIGSKQPGTPFLRPPYYGWGDAIVFYSKCHTCFRCAEIEKGLDDDPTKRNFTDFWYNRNISGENIAALKTPSLTLMIGEGNDGSDKTDARYSFSSFPPGWLRDLNSPAFRHSNGANYLMADGTVHWLKPDEVTTFGGRKNAFALK